MTWPLDPRCRYPGDASLCLCELSGEIHVIRDRGCELCQPAERQPLNPENVEKALRHYQERLSER